MVFVTIGESIQSSLVTVTLLKDNGAKCICAKAGSEMHEKLLLRLGADKVFFPERDAGLRTASIYGRDSVFECIDLAEGHAIYEIACPENWAEKSVGALNVRARYGVNILGVKAYEGAPLNPDIRPDFIFHAEDRILLLGNRESLSKIIG